MSQHIFTGFGFGPIQAGLFVAEAFKSGKFARIVVAEIDRGLVEAVRKNKGSYFINVASSAGIEALEIDGVEIFNPADDRDREELRLALSQSTEICTCLPSVSFYDSGQNSVAALIAQGLANSSAAAAIVYTAENNNHAAEILEDKVTRKLGTIPDNIQFLNTVIGKMSQVVSDRQEILDKNLIPIAPGLSRAFVVEEFNKILVTKCRIQGYRPGIDVFIEKDDLLPFEEAKLYGHNAIHALLAYLGACRGYTKMADLKYNAEIMQIARDAFVNESGASLIRKYGHLGEDLFTPEGYRCYTEDLLRRMMNGYLDDQVERAARDPQRKLGLNDRIFGTMQMALNYGIKPVNMAKAAVAGLKYYQQQIKDTNKGIELHSILKQLWIDQESKYREEIIEQLKQSISIG